MARSPSLRYPLRELIANPLLSRIVSTPMMSPASQVLHHTADHQLLGR